MGTTSLPSTVVGEKSDGEGYLASINELYEGIDELNTTPFTDPTTLPTSGGAAYAGLLNLAVAVGDMTMTANFANCSIGGSVSNIIGAQGLAIAGTLAISSETGSIDRTTDTDIDYTFFADLTGDLSLEGEVFTVYTKIFGDFTGSANVLDLI